MALVLPAQASTLTLSYSGVFGPNATLGGVAFGVDTPFSFAATFDGTADIFPGVEGLGAFDTEVTVRIGSATYTSDPAADLIVFLEDPSFPLAAYAVGVVS